MYREASGHPRKKRKRGDSFKGDDDLARSDSPDRHFAEAETIIPVPTSLLPPALPTLTSSSTIAHSVPLALPLATSSSTNSSHSLSEALPSRKRDRESSQTATSAALPRSYIPQHILDDSQQVPISVERNILSTIDLTCTFPCNLF